MKPRPSDNTVTIVTRVPAPLAATFESRCRAAGTTPSTALRSLVEATVTTRSAEQRVPCPPAALKYLMRVREREATSRRATPATRSSAAPVAKLTPAELAAAKAAGLADDPDKLAAYAQLRAERRQYNADRQRDRKEQRDAIAAQDKYRKSLPSV